jgi:hypothetical protein
MRFLTANECSAWCQTFGYAVPAAWRVDPSSDHTSHQFRIPSDAGQRIALSRLLWGATQDLEEAERLLLVTQWGVWPSSEHMPLFLRWRAAFGDSRALTEAPGHLIQSSDREDGLSAFILGSLFSWDCWLYVGTGMVIQLSHDEIGVVFERVNATQRSIRDELSDFGVLL